MLPARRPSDDRAFVRPFIARRGRARCEVRPPAPLTVRLPVVTHEDRVLLLRAVVAVMQTMVAEPGGVVPARLQEAGSVAVQLRRGETVVRVPAGIAGALCACLHDLTGR